MSNPRKAAVEALLAIRLGRHAQAALNSSLALLAPASRQLCSDLVYGTLRSEIRIRYILAKTLPRPEGLPAAVLASLETAVYSILFQAGIPAYAILNETVKLVKKGFGQRLANVANGALRSVLKFADQARERDWYGRDNEHVFFGIPREIAELWRKAYGNEQATALMARSSARPWTGLRVNMRNGQAREILDALLRNPDAVKVGQAGVAFPPGKTPQEILGRPVSEFEGILSFQAAGSQLVLENLDIFTDWRNELIWDGCAGSGGKSLALLEAGLNIGLATDTSRERLARLGPECKRLSLPIPNLALARAEQAPLKFWPGNILLDVPCSGLGVLSRRPDIRLRFGKARLAELEAVQAGILEAVSSMLLPGKELAYITCTLNPAENQRQAENLAGFELVSEWQTPHEHPWLEGMYGARLRKK